MSCRKMLSDTAVPTIVPHPGRSIGAIADPIPAPILDTTNAAKRVPASLSESDKKEGDVRTSQNGEDMSPPS